MANQVHCRYDCYQITLKANIPEEDGCLYSKYGQDLFSIKNITGKDACVSCKPCGQSNNNQNGCGREAKIPDAVILSVDIDRCDCTKAVFNLYVKLPCKQIFDSDLVDAIEDVLCSICDVSTKETLKSAWKNIGVSVLTTCPPGEYDRCSILTMINQINAFISLIDTYIQSACPGDLLLLKKLKVLLSQLIIMLNAIILSLVKPNTDFVPQKFTIYSKFDRDIITFLVNPLEHDTVSSGVFTECYQYEATRVPCRRLTEQNDCNVSVSNEECCNFCAIANPVLSPDNLRLVFPLTKELRCLVPELGLPGAILSVAHGKLVTKVRLVPRSPLCDVAYPAMLTYDLKNCTACLEFDIDSVETIDMNGYEHERGILGCSRYVNFNCKKYLSPNFESLAMARRIDVVGVHKCTERVFFSFQICIVPYKGFCVDVCGCKIPTIVDGEVDAKNSYKIQSECGEYSYEFVKKEPPTPSTTFAPCPTTQTP